MTYEEAKNIVVHTHFVGHEVCRFDGQLDYVISEEEEYEAMKMMEEAMEKQIPKPVEYLEDDYSVTYVGCPNCGQEVDLFAHHCKCGQALNWSDEE